MEITQAQYGKHLPRQRANVSMRNLQLIHAILSVTESGCELKRFRKIFTCSDKLDVIFCGFVYFSMLIDAILV